MTDVSYIPPGDLVSCEDEQIQIIGQIQDRGYLIAINKDSFIIDYASANVTGLFDFNPLALHVSSLDEKFTKNGEEAFLEHYAKVILKSHTVNNTYKVSIAGIAYDLIAYLSGSYIVIELDISDSSQDSSTQQLLGEILLRIDTNQTEENGVFQELTLVLKQLLGYDRVMIYKFHEDYHGEVIAETKEEELEPFLGLHYPASDIPQQARELYKKNLTRVISDVHSKPVRIESKINTPLDLSLSHLRSVSPIHIEYLKNMGVGASFSVSIIVENELWGLVACHHRSAKHVDLFKRKSSELISQYVSSQASRLENNLNEKRFENKKRTIAALDSQMRKDWDIQRGLTEHDSNLLDIVECGGAAIFYNNELSTLGKVPEENEIHLLIDWFNDHHSKDAVFSSTKISSLIDGMEEHSASVSGVLIVPLSQDLKECIIWFRPEQLSSVKWAGKDEKGVAQQEDGRYRLTPRKSFDAWKNMVTNTSEKWNESDLSSVVHLKEKILSIIQVKANEIEILNQKLQRAYADLDSFSYTLSHDLRTPVNTIQGYLELFLEDHEEFRDNPMIIRAVHNTEIMSDMIDNILEYSKLGRDNLQMEEVQINEILKDVKDQMITSKKFENLELSVPNNVSVLGNRTMIYQVFLNIIENAIKYGHPERETNIKVTCAEEEGMWLFSIKDNGIGIEVKNLSKIFTLFQRANLNTKVKGTGVGLAIVEKIVKSHNGRIWVESEINTGSIFNILLPKHQ